MVNCSVQFDEIESCLGSEFSIIKLQGVKNEAILISRQNCGSSIKPLVYLKFQVPLCDGLPTRIYACAHKLYFEVEVVKSNPTNKTKDAYSYSDFYVSSLTTPFELVLSFTGITVVYKHLKHNVAGFVSVADNFNVIVRKSAEQYLVRVNAQKVSWDAFDDSKEVAIGALVRLAMYLNTTKSKSIWKVSELKFDLKVVPEFFKCWLFKCANLNEAVTSEGIESSTLPDSSIIGFEDNDRLNPSEMFNSSKNRTKNEYIDEDDIEEMYCILSEGPGLGFEHKPTGIFSYHIYEQFSVENYFSDVVEDGNYSETFLEDVHSLRHSNLIWTITYEQCVDIEIKGITVRVIDEADSDHFFIGLRSMDVRDTSLLEYSSMVSRWVTEKYPICSSHGQQFLVKGRLLHENNNELKTLNIRISVEPLKLRLQQCSVDCLTEYLSKALNESISETENVVLKSPKVPILLNRITFSPDLPICIDYGFISKRQPLNDKLNLNHFLIPNVKAAHFYIRKFTVCDIHVDTYSSILSVINGEIEKSIAESLGIQKSDKRCLSYGTGAIQPTVIIRMFLRLIGYMRPFSFIVSISTAFVNLFRLPYISWKRDGRLWHGLRIAAHHFLPFGAFNAVIMHGLTFSIHYCSLLMWMGRHVCQKVIFRNPSRKSITFTEIPTDIANDENSGQDNLN
ncbi:hypothetical protein ACOME3_009950 [Neoechinorhynchus agilis]